MIVSTWNIRGLNKPLKQKEIRAYLLKNKVDICGILETRVKKGNSKNIFRRIACDWDYCFNNEHAYNGRIWMIWKKDIDVHIIDKGSDFIHCKVTRGDIKTVLTVIYGSNDLHQREDL